MKLEFRKELESLINRHSMESGSNTPDFILCEYLMDCLAAFDRAVVGREKWYGNNSAIRKYTHIATPPAADDIDGRGE